MRSLFITALTLLQLSWSIAEDKHAVSISPLLHHDFGEIVEVEGTIVDDSDTQKRDDLGKHLIQVTMIGDEQVPKPIIIELTTFSFADIKIPPRGSRVRFRGYETGRFTGIPLRAFEDLPRVATTDYHFQSRFQIVRALPPKLVQ